MDYEEEFASQLKNIVIREQPRKQDIIRFAQEEFGNRWKQELATKLVSLSEKKTTFSNQMRNFQGGRENKNPGGKKWYDLAKSINMPEKIHVKSGVSIEVKGDQARGGYRGKARNNRTISFDVSASDLYDLASSGDLSLSRIADEIYGFDFTVDSGLDTSSGEMEITSVSVS